MSNPALSSPFLPTCLAGRVALVTGGGSGIGLEIARQLGRHGAKVVIMGRREAVLAKAVDFLSQEKISAHFVVGDVRREEDGQRAVRETSSRFGRLDTLINAAAGNFLVNAEELSVKGFRTVLDIDSVGTFNMCSAAFPALKAAGNGVIINISATLHYGATWYQVHASAAKAAVDSVTRSLALEWGCYGIRVIGIAPGPIAGTPGLTKLGGSDDTEAMEEMVKEVVPLHRLGTPWDIAMASLFLVSSAGANITGETLVSDGANWMWKPPVAPKEMIREFSKKIERKSRDAGQAKSKL